MWRTVAFLTLLALPGRGAPLAVADAIHVSLATLDDGGATARFYQMRADAPAWSGSSQADIDRQQAMLALSHAEQNGLDASRYQVFGSGDRAADDVALSTALLTYMRDLAIGRPYLRQLDEDQGLSARTFDAAALLDAALREHRLSAMLDGLAPHHSQYQQLKRALAQEIDPGRRDVLAANMERWRWLPPDLEPDRIMVNAAAAELELWLANQPVLASKVIVGRKTDPTPMLRAEGAGVTVNPPWTVPHSIAVKEILPKLKKNAAWLAGHDMVLLDGPSGDPAGLHVNWRAIPAGRFPYRVRQNPGPHNPLGQIKLELPNRFDVYLHDTPGQAGFARTSRALSHGCVRVEKILPLATYALAAEPRAMAAIMTTMHSGDTIYVPMKRKLPVYFLYWTAVAGAQGDVEFRPDLYGRDRRMIAAMRAPVRIAGLPACNRG